MTPLVARLALAVLLLPLSGVFSSCMSYVTIRGSAWPPPTDLAMVDWFLLNAFVATYWMLLWYRQIIWTEKRIGWTWFVTGISLGIGLLAIYCFTSFAQMDMASAIFTTKQIVPVFWILGTVLVWKETPHERLEWLQAQDTGEVACPICKYCLTGLRETRCPECGTEFTIDELFCAQRDREQELEEP